jgi:hypothetical protein
VTAARDEHDHVLIRHALGDLSPAETQNVAAGGHEAPNDYERAAAAVHLARLQRIEPLPARVRAKLEEQARLYVAERNEGQPR